MPVLLSNHLLKYQHSSAQQAGQFAVSLMSIEQTVWDELNSEV